MNRIIALLTAMITSFSIVNSAEVSSLNGISELFYVITHRDEVSESRHEGSVSDYVWNEKDDFDISKTTILQKDKSRDFKILAITDVHFSDYGYRLIFNGITRNHIKKMVRKENPDLILVLGDIVCGEYSSYYSIQLFTQMMDSFGVPWAPVFGNHDMEANCDLNFLADEMMKSKLCLLEKGDKDMGVGNYIINIAEDGKIVESLFMMDSHKSQPDEKQREWFKWAAEGINKYTGNSSQMSVYMHIPLPEYQLAYELAWNGRRWNDGYDAYGELNEKICCQYDEYGNPLQKGFFPMIKELNTVKYVFCGHDHMNDFSINYEGIRLTYLMKVGKSSGYKPGFDGGTVITVDSTGIKEVEQKTIIMGVWKTLEDIK